MKAVDFCRYAQHRAQKHKKPGIPHAEKMKTNMPHAYMTAMICRRFFKSRKNER